MHSPIKTEHPFDRLPFGQFRFLHLNNQIEGDATRTISFHQFAEGGRHRHALLETSNDTVRQGDLDRLFAPLPLALLIGKTEQQGGVLLIEI